MTAEILDGFCATSTEQEGLYYVGYYPLRYTENTDRVLSDMPSDPNILNDTMCGPYNRTGLLCGRCIDGYGPAVYSLDMNCADCSKISTGSAISLYLFLELIPVTLFFLCVHCKNIKFVLNTGMVVSVASSLVFTVISLWCVSL